MPPDYFSITHALARCLSDYLDLIRSKAILLALLLATRFHTDESWHVFTWISWILEKQGALEHTSCHIPKGHFLSRRESLIDAITHEALWPMHEEQCLCLLPVSIHSSGGNVHNFILAPNLASFSACTFAMVFKMISHLLLFPWFIFVAHLCVLPSIGSASVQRFFSYNTILYVLQHRLLGERGQLKIEKNGTL